MPRRNPDPLETPWNRRALMVQLAKGAKTQTQLAGEYGVIQQSISAFAKRHADEIQAIIDNGLDEMTGIALAKKEARLATYQELINRLSAGTPKVAGKDGRVVKDPETGEVVYEIDAGQINKALRSMAEELGQLPARVVITGDLEVKTNYQINGVEPGDLT